MAGNAAAWAPPDSDFADSSWSPPEADFVPQETLGGAAQAAGTGLTNAALGTAENVMNVGSNVENLGIAAYGTTKGILASAYPKTPEGETLARDGRSTITPHGMYHWVQKDPKGNDVDAYNTKPPPADIDARAPTVPNNPDLPEADIKPLMDPQKAHDWVASNVGKGAVDLSENTRANRFIQAGTTGLASALATGPTGLARNAIAGGAGMLAAEGVSEAGGGAAAQNAAALLVGHGVGKIGARPVATAPAAPEAAVPADTRSVSEQMLSAGAPEAAEGGAAATGSAGTPEATEPATAMVQAFDAKHPESAPEGFEGKVMSVQPGGTPIKLAGQPEGTVPAPPGKVRMHLTPDETDPNTVRLNAMQSAETGKGHGTAAMQEVTNDADQHGVSLKLDAAPLDSKSGQTTADLMKFYSAHGFEPDPTGGAAGSMVRHPIEPETPAEAPAETPVAQQGDDNHPMRNGQPYTLMSAEKADMTPAQNADRTRALQAYLYKGGFQHAPTMGSFEGKTENSFAVQTDTPQKKIAMEHLGNIFNQDSVIHVDGDSNAEYRDLAANRMPGAAASPMGKMTMTDPDTARAQPGWTQDGDGNHYIVQPHEGQAAGPTGMNLPGQKGAVGDLEKQSTAGMRSRQSGSMFGGPFKTGAPENAASPADAADRHDTFNRMGFGPVRNSAISGDERQAGMEFQTSKLKNPAGDSVNAQMNSERNTLRAHAQEMIDTTGGSDGLGQTDTLRRGAAMEAPVNGLHQHLEDQMQKVYEAAKAQARATGQPAKIDQFNKFVNGQRSEFESTTDGAQLWKGVMRRAQELGLTEAGSEVFKPATVEQAERLRQYITNAWQPKTSRLIGAMKGALDEDMGKYGGADLFKQARGIRTSMARDIEEPEGVASLLIPKNVNRLGINRNVEQTDVPSHVASMEPGQLTQYLNVLRKAHATDDPALQAAAVKAHQELRAQYANEYKAAADKNQGMWNQSAGNNYLKANEANMRQVFKPEEMQRFADNDNAGRWLALDRSYPGAEAQKQNLATSALQMAGKHAEGIGGVFGHFPGLVAGRLAEAGADKLSNMMTAKNAEKLYTDVSKVPTPAIPGQKGAVGDLGGTQSTAGMRGKQTGGYTPMAREQIERILATAPRGSNAWEKAKAAQDAAGGPRTGQSTAEDFAFGPGQRGAVGNLPKQSTAGAKSKQGGVGKKAPIPDEINAGLTPQERVQLRTDTTARMIDAFNNSPAKTPEYAAAALAGQAKRGWYRASAEAIANVFGPDAPRFGAVLASMSPQTSVQMNFHNAVRTFINWDNAGRPTDPAAIKNIMQQSVQKKNPEDPGLLHAWVPNTINALTHPTPENMQLSGPKVDSFMKNLRGNTNEVTNDAWMAAFAKMNPAKMGGSGNQAGPGKSPTYIAMSAKVRNAATMLTKMTGENWTPSEVQETVWSWAKTAFEHSSAQGEKIQDMVKKGAITDDLIRSTPDFHQLFGSAEHTGFIAGSRYGENAKRLAGTKGASTPAGGPTEKTQAAQRALAPHLNRAAERLNETLEERRAKGEEPNF